MEIRPFIPAAPPPDAQAHPAAPPSEAVHTQEDRAEIRIPRSLKNIARYVSMDTAVKILGSERELKPLWSVKMSDAMVRTNPCVAKDGTVYVGNDDGTLYGIKDGVKQSALVLETDPKERPISSPCQGEDGTIYVTSQGHRLFAVRDGRKAWDLQFEKDICMMSPPSVDSAGTVYLTKLGDGKIYAAKDGELSWDFRPGRGACSFPHVTPDGMVIVGSEGGTLHAVKDGRQVWAADLKDTVRSTPCTDEQGRVYAGGLSGTVYAVRKGKVQWKVKTGREITSGMLAAPDGTIYCATTDNKDNFLTALKDGKKLWDLKINGDGFNGYVYSTPCMSSDGTLFISSKDGCMYGIQCGQIVWECKTGSTIYGAPKVGPFDTAYFGDCDGRLFAFNPFESLKKMLANPGSGASEGAGKVSIETEDEWIIIGGVRLTVKEGR